MSQENVIKQYEYFKRVEAGQFERTGNPVRDNLIISDAKRNREALENKTMKLPNPEGIGFIRVPAFPFLKPEKKAEPVEKEKTKKS